MGSFAGKRLKRCLFLPVELFSCLDASAGKAGTIIVQNAYIIVMPVK